MVLNDTNHVLLLDLQSACSSVEEIWSLSPAPWGITEIGWVETECFQDGCQVGMGYLCHSHHPHRPLHIFLVHSGCKCLEAKLYESGIASMTKP